MSKDPSDDQGSPGDHSTSEILGEFLTVSEIAAVLKVPVSWIYERSRRRGRDRIPHFKLGKYLRFQPAKVRAWLQALEEL